MSDPAAGAPSRATRQAARGGAWTVAERIVSQLAQLAVFIAAARVLGPAEFGIFALVSAVAVVLLRVAELGWPQFIMNWPGDETVPRQVLTLAIISGAAIGAVGLAASWALGALAGARGIAALGALFALWVAASPFAGALHGLMVRRGHLVAASLCEMLGEIAALIVALAALASGAGLLSLAYGRLAYVAVRLSLSVLATRAMPAGGLSDAPLRDMRDFSVQVLATRIVYQLRAHAGTFLVGAFLGAAAVGHYRAAERLTGAAAEIVGAPVEKIAWSYLRQARDAAGIPSALWTERSETFFRTVTLVSIPVFLWIAVMSEEIVLGLIGPEWRPAALAASLLALGRLLMLYGNAVEPVLALAGEIGRMPRAMLVFLACAVGLIAASAPFGLVAVSAAQIALGAIVLAVTLRLLARHAHLGARTVTAGAAPALAAGIAAAGAAAALRHWGLWDGWQPLARAVGIGVAVLPIYAGLVLALDGRLRAAIRAPA